MLKYTKEDLAFVKNSRAEQFKTTVSLKDKICVISGATSGVGLAAANRLAEAGAEVIIVARNLDKAKKVSGQLAQQYAKEPNVYVADFSRLDSVRTKRLSRLIKIIKGLMCLSTRQVYIQHTEN